MSQNDYPGRGGEQQDPARPVILENGLSFCSCSLRDHSCNLIHYEAQLLSGTFIHHIRSQCCFRGLDERDLYRRTGRQNTCLWCTSVKILRG